MLGLTEKYEFKIKLFKNSIYGHKPEAVQFTLDIPSLPPLDPPSTAIHLALTHTSRIQTISCPFTFCQSMGCTADKRKSSFTHSQGHSLLGRVLQWLVLSMELHPVLQIAPSPCLQVYSGNRCYSLHLPWAASVPFIASLNPEHSSKNDSFIQLFLSPLLKGQLSASGILTPILLCHQWPRTRP